MAEQFMSNVSSFFLDCQPTFYGAEYFSTTDDFFLPQGFLNCVSSGQIPMGLARRCQMIQSRYALDHVSMVFRTTYELQHTLPMEVSQAWDYDLLARAISQGNGKKEFFTDIEHTLDENCEYLDNNFRKGNPNTYWESILHILKPVCLKHFVRAASIQTKLI